MLQKAIDTYEELKKYVFIIDRGDKGCIKIRFTNANFYHLIGFQHTHIDMFIPTDIATKSNKYKYIKKNIPKFEHILKSEISDNETLINRVSSFSNILDIVSMNNSMLYDLKQKVPGSVYEGDYCLMKLYENLCCLLGLKINDEFEENVIYCSPQSWMASKESNRLIENKRPIYMKSISMIPSNVL